MPILRRAINIAGTRLYDPSMAAGDGVFADTTYAGGGRYAGVHKSGKKGAQLREGEASGNVAWLLPQDYTPNDRGYLYEAFRGDVVPTATVAGAGTIFVFRKRIVEADTVSKIVIGVNIAGVGLSNCFVGVYQSGTLLGQSADQSTNWQAVGKNPASLTSTVSLAVGDAIFAFLIGGATTGPTIARGNNAATAGTGNGELTTAGTALYGLAGSGLTALPATLPAITANSGCFWLAAIR